MTFEQEIAAIDNLAKSCRDRSQANDLLEKQVLELTADKKYLQGRLEENNYRFEQALENEAKTRDKYEQEVRSNGELKATLKQLLAEQMSLASRAAEMLRSLETPPEMIAPKTIEIVKPTFASEMIDAHKKDQEERLLELHVQTTLNDIAKVPSGETFVLDAPYGERITDWLLKKWYRRILGKAPGNYKTAPSIKLRKLPDGGWTDLGQAPKLTNIIEKEGREPIPFCSEETKLEGNGKAPNPFVDNGEAVPSFLMQGPNYADQGRKSSDL